LRRHPSFSVRLVSDDGTTVTRRTPLVFIGNNRYEMNGLRIGSRPSLETGKLAVYVLHREGALSLLRMGVEAVFGRLRDGVDFDFFLTTSVRIEVRRPHVHVAIDGEVSTFAPPLIYRTHPRALRVLVPDGEPPKAG
jgi:diacylglycerol kinase family enzyme